MEEEISNHIKTGEGCSYKAVSVTPKIWMSTEVHGGNSVAIRIADNGSGIKAEVQQQLFEPMFTTKLVVKNTGLALSISRQIIEEKHCGRLTCISSLGHGAGF